MSIVRIGMSEDSKFADGYDAIFGKSSGATGKTAKKPAAKAAAKKPAAKKKPADAKKTAKKK